MALMLRLCSRRATPAMIEQLRQQAREAEAAELARRRRTQYAAAQRAGGRRPDPEYEVVDDDSDEEDLPNIPPARSVKQRLRPAFVRRSSSAEEPRVLAHRTYKSWFAATFALTSLNKRLSYNGPHLRDNAVIKPAFEAETWVLRWSLFVTRKVIGRFHSHLSNMLKERKQLAQNLD